MRMLSSGVHLHPAEHVPAKGVLGQHTFNGVLDGPFRVPVQKAFEGW